MTSRATIHLFRFSRVQTFKVCQVPTLLGHLLTITYQPLSVSRNHSHLAAHTPCTSCPKHWLQLASCPAITAATTRHIVCKPLAYSLVPVNHAQDALSSSQHTSRSNSPYRSAFLSFSLMVAAGYDSLHISITLNTGAGAKLSHSTSPPAPH